ncbi:MAG: hypothetical protein ACREJ5_25935 [Geminicoccaceae bacterium]
MAMKDLPRPWLLAALADVPVTELALDADASRTDEQEPSLPRADQRRRRLAAWRGPGHPYVYDDWWHPSVEAERPS